MKPPCAYLGGKQRLTPKLIKMLPPHRIYVEPFGGMASLLFAKEPSPIEIYNDLDGAIVNFFTVLKDPGSFAWFQKLCLLTPFSRQVFEEYRDQREVMRIDGSVEWAYKWFYVMANSFSGVWGHSFRSAYNTSARGMAKTVSQWLSSIDRLPEIHSRLMRVVIENQNALKLIEKYDTPETLYYLDPPYHPDTRTGRGKYANEMTAEDHEKLIDLIVRLKGMVIVSGYDCNTYRILDWKEGFELKRYDVTCSCAGRTRVNGILGRKSPRRTEMVWLSPNTVKRLNESKLPLIAEEGICHV